MSDAIVTRGPDDSGTWFDHSSRVGFAHRRLAIQDLSELGRQPMESACGRYVISLNGEIYNFQTLRRQLEREGILFRGHSDTEVLVSAISCWGVEEAIAKACGMFAFALFDKKQRELWLARDRAGEKPLYYGWNNGLFLFGSVLTAIEAIPEFEGQIEPNAIGSLLANKYIAAPLSIYRGIFKLRPGHVARLRLSNATPTQPETRPYWVHPHLRPGDNGAGVLTRDVGLLRPKERIKDCLEHVIREQVLSDRPIGAFLSGGIDSSLITSLMQSLSGSPIRTFTIGFHEAEFDEASRARAIAEHLGTDHTEVYLSANEGLEMIPEIATCFDEPFADSSQIPTMLISKIAREDVTVVLSGDGGDEVFGGYDRYTRCIDIWRSLQTYPLVLRRPLALGLRMLDREVVDRLLSPLLGVISPRRRGRSVASLFRHGASRLGASGIFPIYLELMSEWNPVTDVAPRATDTPPAIHNHPYFGSDAQVLALMASDFHTYLPGDVLVKVDRSSMHYSLETRAPLLDVRVLEASSGIDWRYMHRNGVGKILLRSLLRDFLPERLTEFPKQGFAVPIAQWLRGPLLEWAEDRLSDGVLKEIGWLNAELVRARWQQHKDGVWDNSSSLWCVLMLVEWMWSRRLTDA